MEKMPHVFLLHVPSWLSTAVILTTILFACYAVRSSPDAYTLFNTPQPINFADVAMPVAYRGDPVTRHFTFPSSVVVDDENRVYIIEAGYSYGEDGAAPRILRVESNGHLTEVAVGKTPPWTGATFHEGAFYISEGGNQGRILRITLDGKITPLAENVATRTDQHAERPLTSADNWIYFTQNRIGDYGAAGGIRATLNSKPRLLI